MTIKDMELQTGLARANIRYYEAEGLITPERAENGYRDYSQEDAETLLRVKLLRALGLTVGQIKAVVRGETELDAALSARIAAIQKEKTALDRAGEIAGRIRQAHAQFRTLDARPYLDEMQTERVLERDTLPKEHFPWQRFFARLLDAQIYRSLWVLILPALGFNMLKSSRGGVLFLELLTLGTMFLLEPLLLSRFGTTPGKWLFGLRVTSPDGIPGLVRDPAESAVFPPVPPACQLHRRAAGEGASVGGSLRADHPGSCRLAFRSCGCACGAADCGRRFARAAAVWPDP